MPYPVKPASPVFNSGDPFASGLLGYWLANEETGSTIVDWSGNDFHLSIVIASGGWTNPTGTCPIIYMQANASNWAVLSNINSALINFAAGDPYTEMIWARVIQPTGSVPRLFKRAGDVTDKGVWAANTVQYFNGSTWVPTGDTAATDSAECFIFGAESNASGGHRLHYWKNGVKVNTYGIAGVANTGVLSLMSNAFSGPVRYEFVMASIHNRLLSDADAISYYSNPIGVVTAPAPPPPTYDNPIVTFGQGGYYQPQRELRNPSLIDWLGGA